MRIFIIFCLMFIIAFMIVKKSDTNISNTDMLSNQSIKEKLEYAYASGQRDAIDGKINIEHVDSNCYVFTKSPWIQNVGVVRETLWLSE